MNAVQALPPDVFDWSRIVYVEMDGIRNGLVLLKKSGDARKLSAESGQDSGQYGSKPRPTEDDLQQFDSIMREAVRLFALPSAQTEQGIRALDEKVEKVSPVVRDALHWLDSANKARKQVEQLRGAFLTKAAS